MRAKVWVGRDKSYELDWEGYDLWIGLGGMTAMDRVGRNESYELGWEGFGRDESYGLWVGRDEAIGWIGREGCYGLAWDG